MTSAPVVARRLGRDFALLSALQFSSIVVPLLVLPLLVRRVSVPLWGSLSAGMSTGWLLRAVVEYGFEVTGTVAAARMVGSPDDVHALAKKVIASKCVLLPIALVGGALVLGTMPVAREHLGIAVAGAVATMVPGIASPWLLIAVGRAARAAISDIVPRLIAACLSIALVRGPASLWIYPAVFLSASLLTAVLQYRAVGVSLPVAIRLSTVRHTLRSHSASMTLRMLVLIYTSAAGALLGFVGSAENVAVYANADRLVRFGVLLASPLAQITTPLMSRAFSVSDSIDWRVVRRVVAVSAAVGAMCSVAMFVAGPVVVTSLFGESYAASAAVVRLLSPLPFLVIMSGVFGLQWLVARGELRAVNRCVALGSVVGLALMITLGSRGGANGAAVAVIAAELVVTVGVTVRALVGWRLVRAPAPRLQ